MNAIIYSLVLAIFSLGFCSNSWALAPVESLVLGDFSKDYSENKTDPLNYVFTRDADLKTSNLEYKRELAIYRGFYEEGKNAANYCKERREIFYQTEWEKVQMKRSFMALIQYIGLDLTTRALPQYAKKLEFTNEEYNNMVESLVGNYCSNNLSIISKKELLTNMRLKYDRENNFKLPSTEGNPYFPDNLESYLPTKNAIEQEFIFTVKIFQAACSWSGNPNNPGLLIPFLKNPALIAFFTRQMNNQAIGWKEIDNSLFLKEDKNTVQVWCDNLICRKVDWETFFNKVYYSVGGTNVAEDMRRLYCEEFRTLDYLPKESDERLAKIMNTRSFDEENFMNSQFIALITGVPDFLLRAEKFTDGEDVLRSSLDYTWSKWAKNAGSDLSRDLYFEEPLTLELVDQSQYYDERDPKLKVAFDVNLGEFDRINQRVGKVRVNFNLSVSNAFLRHYRDTLKNIEFGDKETKAKLLERFKIQLTKGVNEAREKFLIPPWKGDLESLIASELTTQILDKSEKVLKLDMEGNHSIEIELNYGIFALKYINHQLNVKKSQEKNQNNSKK